MKKIIIFTLGFLTALILGASYRTFSQNKAFILPNPFSVKEKIDVSEESSNPKTESASSTATSTIH